MLGRTGRQVLEVQDLQRRRASQADQVGAGPAIQRVHACSAIQDIGSVSAEQRVIALLSAQEVVAIPAQNGVVDRGALQEVVKGRARQVLELAEHVSGCVAPIGEHVQHDRHAGIRVAIVRRIAVDAARERVGARAARHPVVPEASRDAVIAGTTIDHVKAGIAEHHVVVVAAIDLVVAAAAIDHIIVVAAVNVVLAVQPADQVVALATIKLVRRLRTADGVVPGTAAQRERAQTTDKAGERRDLHDVVPVAAIGDNGAAKEVHEARSREGDHVVALATQKDQRAVHHRQPIGSGDDVIAVATVQRGLAALDRQAAAAAHDGVVIGSASGVDRGCTRKTGGRVVHTDEPSRACSVEGGQ